MKRQRPAPYSKKPALKRQKTLGSFYKPPVYSASKAEAKVNDIATATYQVHTTGVFTLLCNPSLGSDMNNRIGRKIRIKSAYVRGYVGTQPALGAATNSTSAQCARMIIFTDNQPNGAAPAVTDLLNSADPCSHLNLNNRDRFVIHHDKEFVFDPYTLVNTATQAQAASTNQIRMVKKFKKITTEMVFNAGVAGTIADINSGALYMFWIGSTASGTTDVNAILSTRVRYWDF